MLWFGVCFGLYALEIMCCMCVTIRCLLYVPICLGLMLNECLWNWMFVWWIRVQENPRKPMFGENHQTGLIMIEWWWMNEMITRTLDYVLHAWYRLTVVTVWDRVCVIVRKNEPKPKLPVRVKTGQWSGNSILRPLEAEFEKNQNGKVVGNWKL